MKNTLLDLNNHLFAQMERLNNESIKDDELKAEVDRAKAMSNIAKSITETANLQMRAVEIRAAHIGLMRDDIPHNLVSFKDKD